MNRWLRGAVAGTSVGVALATVPFVLGLKGDSHMGNWLGVLGLVAVLIAMLPALLLGYALERTGPGSGAFFIAPAACLLFFVAEVALVLGLSIDTLLWAGAFLAIPGGAAFLAVALKA